MHRELPVVGAPTTPMVLQPIRVRFGILYAVIVVIRAGTRRGRNHLTSCAFSVRWFYESRALRYDWRMSGCTAPRYGHRTASGRENCPVCRYRRYGYGGGYGGGYSSPAYYPSSVSSRGSSGSGGGRSSSGGFGGSGRPSWSPVGSSVVYTPAEVSALTPIRESLEKRPPQPDRRDFFLCHAWDDRRGSAKELNDLLVSLEVSVWFSEKDISLGTPFLREIDKGLAKSRGGIVLVTPALLDRLRAEVSSTADKELSALLARDQLIPVVHHTTYDALRDVSPLLGSRNGLDTAENTMQEVAAKLAELAAVAV